MRLQQNITFVLAAFSLLCALVFLSVPLAVGAQTPAAPSPLNSASPDITNSLCAGVNLKLDSNCTTGGISDQEAQDRIDRIIKTIINLFSLVVGVVSVIMIIVGGLKYITSGGDSSSVTGAKNTILYAIIGLVIVALSQVIVRFILSRVTTT